MTSAAGDVRSTALDAYIARRVAQGFRVETRSGAQAVIVRRHRLYFVLHFFVRGLADSGMWSLSTSTARLTRLRQSRFAGDASGVRFEATVVAATPDPVAR
jgi:hypothetical protein